MDPILGILILVVVYFVEKALNTFKEEEEAEKKAYFRRLDEQRKRESQAGNANK